MGSKVFTVDVDDIIEDLIEESRRSIRFTVANTLMACVKAGTEAYIENTPVWTGETISNFFWSMGKPSNESVKFDARWWEDQYPVGSGSFDAEARFEALSIRREVFSNPYRTLYLVNNVTYDDGETLEDLEDGSLTGTEYMITSEVEDAILGVLERVR